MKYAKKLRKGDKVAIVEPDFDSKYPFENFIIKKYKNVDGEYIFALQKVDEEYIFVLQNVDCKH